MGSEVSLALAVLTAGSCRDHLRREVIEDSGRATQAPALVESTPRMRTHHKFLPSSRQCRDYRRWVDPQLRSELVQGTDDSQSEHLHASLALLPVDASQVDYLFNRLLTATPSELPVLRDALKTHRTTLTPKLWTVLESAKPGDASLLPAASALASYDPDNAKWEAVGGKVAQALVSVNSILLGPGSKPCVPCVAS